MVYFTRPNLQEISASASPLWFSRLSYLRGSWPLPIASALALYVERGCGQPAPLSVLSTWNRRVSESRFSNLPVRARSASMGLNGGAGPLSAAAEALAGVCNVLTASAMASGRRQRSLVIFSLLQGAGMAGPGGRNGDLFRVVERRVLLKLRQCRVHLIPGLRVRCEDIELRTKRARVIQARSTDANEGRRGIDCSQKPGTTVRTKTARVRAAGHARRGIVPR